VMGKYGDKPKDLDGEMSLRQLLNNRSLYGQLPQHMASYSCDKRRALKGDVQPKDAVELLPPVAAGLLKHSERHIERSTEDTESLRDEGELSTPHWDPTLRRDARAWAHLVRALYRARLCSARRNVKARVGICSVQEKDGNIILICDSRVPNALHRRPPKAKLGGVDALAELNLTGMYDGETDIGSLDLDAGTIDVKNAFQHSVKEAASWFGLGHKIRAKEWGVKKVWGDDLKYCCLGAACVDNVTVVTAKPPGSSACRAALQGVAESRCLSLQPPEVGKVAESPGLVLDLESREVWFVHAINMIGLRRPLMSIFQEAHRRLDFRRERRAQIGYVLWRETWAVQSQVFFSYAGLDTPVSKWVHVPDISTQGRGLLRQVVAAPVICKEMRCRERWRSMEIEPQPERHFISTGVARDLVWGWAEAGDYQGDEQVFADPGAVPDRRAACWRGRSLRPRSSRGGKRRQGAAQSQGAPAQRRGGGGACCDPAGLQVLGGSIGMDSGCARAARLAEGARHREGGARRFGRRAPARSKPTPAMTSRPHLVDDMATRCFFDKGRGRSWANAVRRRLRACQLAADFRPRWSRVDSECCAAGGGPRRQPALVAAPPEMAEGPVSAPLLPRGRLELETAVESARR
ncbi:unnamed protein product, partial [Prorocentrum cordatum]